MMKKIFFTLCLISMIFPVFANLNGNGYYRVRNVGTQRWASLVDNKATVDKIAGDAELHALQLSKDTEAILSDPGSIVYITKESGNYQYDLAAQGTSLESLVDNPVYIRSYGTSNGEQYYRIYGTYKNTTKFISDGNLILSQNYGDATLNDMGEVTVKNWNFYPVDVNSEYYFGTVPTLTVGGTPYCTLFTSFAYKPYSAGVKAYYIGRIGFGMAEMIEIDGAVPTGSPVIIQCAGDNVADNKLQIENNTPSALPSNALNGVYFNYAKNNITNHVAYNPETMRILGITSDGSLGFITSNISYIPANTAYLKVPKGSAPEFKCVSTAEYELNIPDAPEQIYMDESNVLQPQDEYSYSGTFNFPATKNLSFQFYTSSSLDKESLIGAYSSNNKNVTIDATSNNTYPFQYGSNAAWVIPSWAGGNLYITINLQYQYVYFSSIGAVDSLVNENGELKYVDGKLLSNGLITVYNLTGQTMVSSSSGLLDTADLPKGIYVAVSNGNSIKLKR